jgi:hypothetical protein
MDSFYWIVLTLASFILIGLLAFIGWTMANQKKGTKYPTITTSCPDNWKVVKGSDNKVFCQRPDTGTYNNGGTALDSYFNTNNNPPSIGLTTLKGNGSAAGTGNDYTNSLLDFESTEWGKDGNPVCAKRDWATKYNIRWDSVENANYC